MTYAYDPTDDDGQTDDYPDAFHYLDDPYELVSARGYLTARKVA